MKEEENKMDPHIVQTQCSRLKVNTRGRVASVVRRAEESKRSMLQSADTLERLQQQTARQAREIDELRGIEAIRTLQFINAKLQADIEREVQRSLTKKLTKLRSRDYLTRQGTQYDRTQIFEALALEEKGATAAQEQMLRKTVVEKDIAMSCAHRKMAALQGAHAEERVYRAQRELETALRRCDEVNGVMSSLL